MNPVAEHTAVTTPAAIKTAVTTTGATTPKAHAREPVVTRGPPPTPLPHCRCFPFYQPCGDADGDDLHCGAPGECKCMRWWANIPSTYRSLPHASYRWVVEKF